MKIAFIFDSFEVGGIERVGADYVNMLYEHGHLVTVYNLHPNENAFKIELPEGVEYKEVKFDRKICPELYSYGVKRWWWGKFAYPILHTVLSLYVRLKKILFVKDKYDVAIAFSGHINDLTFLTSGFLKTEKKVAWCHGAILPYLAVCDGYADLYKKVDALVTLSDMLQYSIYAGHAFLHEKKIKRIYNPSYIQSRDIDENKVENIKQRYGDFVLMVARATEQKDHKTAILAMKQLKQMGVCKNIVFLGDGELKERLVEFAKLEEMSDSCFFAGNVQDVQNYIKASHINLLASIYEGLPTVMVEAMGLAKPCVMTISDGGELSQYGKYCFLTPIGDYKAIAQALYQLYSNEKIYKEYENLSMERFEYFKPEKIYTEVSEFLKLNG